ncbi:toll/interleukin-1 receptor domain-containing protein [Caulobacter sp. RHG1]|uniref:toll/interleukin-1 receptor domain-containing protein n=1 Tax=Caulobacter sp. (strain RHG1) TaxID=2545762 RepID=UPI0015541640|nr:toll/interleukin-1 receptor domain-containing protein [Caulobacter sp. RHG1]NQE61250.1 Transcriptional regulator [Caulobacter sp. RHG1]
MDSRQQYKAFISYSHKDRKIAEWLHRALETYRAPRALTKARDGASAGALRPIFRDREELSASSNLSEVIQDALDRSEALIVLCSPFSAASRWVDQEVAHVIERGDVARIICLITPETPADATLDSVLPGALRAALPEGVEPLAVDLRPNGDGRRLARLKIAARLLDVSLDQLVQRDARRRLQVMTAFTAAAVVVSVGMGAMTVLTLQSRKVARAQRDETEALVAYMLGDLREQLEPVGRLDVLDGVGGRVLAYYAKASEDRLDDKALAQRAKAQTLLGTIREQRSDWKGAEDAFAQAAATTHALVQRDPNNGERIFDEAQNVFWVAYMKQRRGDPAAAERGFKRYEELARRLVALDPNRSEWRIEVAYANSNLGTLMFKQGRPAEALAAFRKALVVQEAELARAPGNNARVSDSANTRAWVADSLLMMGRPSEAYVEREAATRLLARATAASPGDKRLAAKNVASLSALARLELDLGREAQARTHAASALKALSELAALDPTNARWREHLLIARLDTVDIEAWSGATGLAKAKAIHTEAIAELAKIRTGQSAQVWRPDLDGRLKQQAVVLATLDGDAKRARDLAQALLGEIHAAPSAREGRQDLSAQEGFANLEAGRPDAAIALLAPKRQALPPGTLDNLARAYAATGRMAEARAIVIELQKHGYAHPAFLAFWKESALGGAVSREAL